MDCSKKVFCGTSEVDGWRVTTQGSQKIEHSERNLSARNRLVKESELMNLTMSKLVA
jgi:hypothetical protein